MRTCLFFGSKSAGCLALTRGLQARWPAIRLTHAEDFYHARQAMLEQPEFCVIGLASAAAGGLSELLRLKYFANKVPVFVVCEKQDDHTLLALLGADVSGVAFEQDEIALVLAAIDLTLAGGRYFPPRLAELVVRQAEVEMPVAEQVIEAHVVEPHVVEPHVVEPHVVEPHVEQSIADLPALAPTIERLTCADQTAGAQALTSRQFDVLKLVSTGKSNKEIARSLGLAPSTIKTHVQHLFESLGVSNRTAVTARAHELRLV